MKKILTLVSVIMLILTACASRVYTVSNIVYTFDTANPPNLIMITLDLDNPATDVKVGIGDTVYNLQACESAEPFTHWICALTGVTVAESSSLRIVVK
jgi:hypothetical protein